MSSRVPKRYHAECWRMTVSPEFLEGKLPRDWMASAPACLLGYQQKIEPKHHAATAWFSSHD